MEKSELLEALETSHEKILSLIEDIPVDDLSRPGAMGDWSVKDLISHLLIWEAETIKLLYMARLNRKPDTAHFKTISDDEQNSIWYEQFKDRPYERVWQDYATIRDQTIERVSEFSDVDLNNPNLFPWLQGSSLSQLLESFILQHETEHTTALNRWRETRS
ncbi:MAG: ClbS/DfsB family four-helix bundle protein [Bellilinea sp.]